LLINCLACALISIYITTRMFKLAQAHFMIILYSIYHSFSFIFKKKTNNVNIHSFYVYIYKHISTLQHVGIVFFCCCYCFFFFVLFICILRRKHAGLRAECRSKRNGMTKCGRNHFGYIYIVHGAQRLYFNSNVEFSFRLSVVVACFSYCILSLSLFFLFLSCRCNPSFSLLFFSFLLFIYFLSS
jgi:hypothetical protein